MVNKKLILILLASIILTNIILFSLLKSYFQPFKVGDIKILSTDIARIGFNGEVNILMNFEDKGRIVNTALLIQANKQIVEEISVNMKCSILGRTLFEGVKEDYDLNRYIFSSNLPESIDFLLNGYMDFIRYGEDGAEITGGTINGTDLIPGTRILKLYKHYKQGAELRIDFHFRGEQPEKVKCIIMLTSKNPKYQTTKEIYLDYPGIKGFKVNREN